MLETIAIDYFVCCDRCGHFSRSSDCIVFDDEHAPDSLYVVCRACRPVPYIRPPWYRSEYFKQASQGAAIGIVIGVVITLLSLWFGR